MRKIPVTKEKFQEWFDDPVAELQKFLNSGEAIMAVRFGNNRLVELSQRDAARLLIEFGVEPPLRDE
jgi:hypothetical protein